MDHLELALHFFFLYYVGVLKVHMRSPSYSSRHAFHRLNSLMTNLLDHSLNILVITWSSLFSPSFNLDTTTWFKHCLWTFP
jgi:hypothetical protein